MIIRLRPSVVANELAPPERLPTEPVSVSMVTRMPDQLSQARIVGLLGNLRFGVHPSKREPVIEILERIADRMLAKPIIGRF